MAKESSCDITTTRQVLGTSHEQNAETAPLGVHCLRKFIFIRNKWTGLEDTFSSTVNYFRKNQTDGHPQYATSNDSVIKPYEMRTVTASEKVNQTLYLPVTKISRTKQCLTRQSWYAHYCSQRHGHLSNCSLRTFIATLFTLTCTSLITFVNSQPPPLPPAGFLDFDNLPVTRFSCEGKVIGGYYADVETGCQMFHVCTLGQKDEIQDIKFLCLNGTVFDQETRVCERVDEVDCSKAEQYFDLNLDLYAPHVTTQKPEEIELEEEDDIVRPLATSKSKVASNVTKTTTTSTTTPSPRTRAPSISSKSRPPVVASSSSSSQESEDDDDGDNGYTSFNYYLKTPHSHVASGYNSQSRQSYLINQPGSIGRSSGSGTGSSSSTGRKVPTGSQTIIYSSTSTSSSTAKPSTVIVVKATLPPLKSTLREKTTQRTAIVTTLPPPPKFEDEQYDEYYDDEDYSEQPAVASKQASYPSQQQGVARTRYESPKSSTSPFDFRDGRSTKGVIHTGIADSTNGGTRGESRNSELNSSVGSVTPASKARGGQPATPAIKVLSTEFVANNSTEEPYYYEDDYPDDVAVQQQQVLQPSSVYVKSKNEGTNTKLISKPGNKTLSRAPVGVSANTASSIRKGTKFQSAEKEGESTGLDSDYYDDDNDNVNAHDHHFTHVDVPRIPFAKPNVPRILVTNGKPFLPRLRRQSYLHQYYQTYPMLPVASSLPTVRRSSHRYPINEPKGRAPSVLLASKGSMTSDLTRQRNVLETMKADKILIPIQAHKMGSHNHR